MRYSTFPLCAALLWSCASTPAEKPELRAAQLKMQDLRERVDQLETQQQRLARENTTLIAKNNTLTERLGQRPFAPKHLKSGSAQARFVPGVSRFIQTHESKPFSASLASYVAQFDAYVVAVWATWCKPCTSPEELEHLTSLQAELRQHGSELVGLAIDKIKTVQTHRRAAEWHYPIWHRLDGHIEWLPEVFIRRVGLSLPLFLVVSREGELLYYYQSKLSDEVRSELVTATLSHVPSRVPPERALKRSRRR